MAEQNCAVKCEKTPFVAKRHRKPLNEDTERVIKILAGWQSGIYREEGKQGRGKTHQDNHWGREENIETGRVK